MVHTWGPETAHNIRLFHLVGMVENIPVWGWTRGHFSVYVVCGVIQYCFTQGVVKYFLIFLAFVHFEVAACAMEIGHSSKASV